MFAKGSMGQNYIRLDVFLERIDKKPLIEGEGRLRMYDNIFRHHRENYLTCTDLSIWSWLLKSL